MSISDLLSSSGWIFLNCLEICLQPYMLACYMAARQARPIGGKAYYRASWLACGSSAARGWHAKAGGTATHAASLRKAVSSRRQMVEGANPHSRRTTPKRDAATLSQLLARHSSQGAGQRVKVLQARMSACGRAVRKQATLLTTSGREAGMPSNRLHAINCRRYSRVFQDVFICPLPSRVHLGLVGTRRCPDVFRTNQF